MNAQGLGERRSSVDLSVSESDYYGAPLSEIDNLDLFGLEPGPETDLYRVSYLFLLVFGNDADNERTDTDYGGIQVRANTFLYLEDGRVPMRVQKVMQRAAHRGAYLFDSDVEESIYGMSSEWGDGYLTGFNAVEKGDNYRNWEVEPVGSRARSELLGKIEWTTELYLEVTNEGGGATDYAVLSGQAQGLANPWGLRRVEEPGREGVEAQQEWWQIAPKFNEARGSYQIAPPGYSDARERAKQLRGKVVHINGLPVGEVVKDGRVWLKDEYAAGDTYRGDYSREGIVQNTVATWQSLALGRKIAKVDESPTAVYLATAGARPDDFDPVNPDEVDPDREVVPPRPPTDKLLLTLQSPEEPTLIECRQDEEVIRHMGYSDPTYSHRLAGMYAWPGFRAVEEYGTTTTVEDLHDDTDDDQSGLGDYGGGGA